MSTPYEKVIELVGSQAALAKAMNISRQAVNDWGGKIPSGRALEVVNLVNGEVTLEELFNQ